MSLEVSDPLEELTQILSSVDARMRLNRSRLTRPILHDSDYHIAVIACAMRIYGEGSPKRILTPWLKLLQFLAARPALVDRFLDYVAGRRHATDLDSWSKMPRGYLGDEVHERVVDLLVARQVVRKVGDCIEAASAFEVLDALALRIFSEGLFSGERAIMERLLDVKVSKALLGFT